jgi:predicted ArsR family transcriptional regulator
MESEGRPAGRARVLQALRSTGRPISSEALAAEVGLSVTTTRFHLRNLVTVGSVLRERDAEHHRPGRPRVMFRALPAEAGEAGAAYAHLAGLLAQELAAVAGPGAALAAGERWGRRLVAGRGVAAEPRAAVDQLVEVLEHEGFSARLTDDAGTVELHSCPHSGLARTQSEIVCTVHLGLVRALLPANDSRSVRVVPVLDGSGPCLVRLPTALITTSPMEKNR